MTPPDLQTSKAKKQGEWERELASSGRSPAENEGGGSQTKKKKKNVGDNLTLSLGGA